MDLSDRYLAWKERGGHAKLVTGVLGAAMLPAGMYASGRQPPVPLVLFVPIGAATGYVIAAAINWVTLTGPARAAQSVYMPATAGFYANEHSEIDTLEVRGNFAAAASAWEAVAIAEPGNPWPLVRSGELHAKELRDPVTAIERFRLARSMPAIKPELERYVSQKIIGLLLGPLEERGRAMTEMRMLIDRHPRSREAEGAREALRALKAGQE